MEEIDKKTKNIGKFLVGSIGKVFLIIALIISLSGVFLTFSLREVFKNATADEAFKDHKDEYNALKGD